MILSYKVFSTVWKQQLDFTKVRQRGRRRDFSFGLSLSLWGENGNIYLIQLCTSTGLSNLESRKKNWIKKPAIKWHDDFVSKRSVTSIVIWQRSRLDVLGQDNREKNYCGPFSQENTDKLSHISNMGLNLNEDHNIVLHQLFCMPKCSGLLKYAWTLNIFIPFLNAKSQYWGPLYS